MNGKSIESVLIQNVQYVPKICANLLSVRQMVRQGHVVIFKHNKCEIFDANKTLIASATMHNNMFKIVHQFHNVILRIPTIIQITFCGIGDLVTQVTINFENFQKSPIVS